VLVKYKNLKGKNDASAMSNNVYMEIAKQNVEAMELTKKQIETLRQNENIIRIEPDAKAYATELLRSRELAEEEPYGIEMVLEDVDWWKSKFASSPPTGSAKVCVVDTGYGNGHEDLPTLDQNSDGYNPQSSGEWYIDGHSHGTHCAGSIGALGDNSKGVVGVIPGSISDKFSFFIGKGLSDSGSGSTSSVMAAVQACVDNGSNVISMSLGGGSPSDSVNQQYYGHYKDDDVLIIAAAGNGGNSALSYPASYKSVMSVAAVDSSENKAGFSQYNEQTEISGPGVSVKSTVTGNSGSTFSYASYSGTSMATPHVAGVAGLLRMYFPNCKAFQIRNAMIVTAKDKGDAGCDVNYGHGIVQAKAAFEYLEANACDPNEAFKEPEGGCAEFSCSEDSDCDDGNPDTIDTCASGSCQYACATDASCDDGDPCTADTCTDGVCSSVFDCSICGGGASSLLELTTDNYPAETAWDIKNSSGDEKYNGSGYSDANTLHSIDMCLASDEYTFSITDAYGDGICCSYGNGGYKIIVDGTEVVNGGNFGNSETETFTVNANPTAPSPSAPSPTSPGGGGPCGCGPANGMNQPECNGKSWTQCNQMVNNEGKCKWTVCNPPTPAPVSTSAPVTDTNSPVSTPDTNSPVSSVPSTTPVTTPTAPVVAPNGCEMFIITLNTDSYGYETSFTLVNDHTGGTRLAGGLYASSKSFDEVTCLNNGRYIFTVSDEHGDGMCCGNGQGGYKLTLGGEVVKEGGDFGESESFVVEVGPQGPSRAPTPAPTCTPVGEACTFGENCCSGRCGNNVCK